MKFQTIVTEEDGTLIFDTGELPENSEVSYVVDDREVTIINKING